MRVAALLLALLVTAPAGAPDGREMVWEGYLFKDDEGRTRVGWPVVAMGVMDQPAHVVGGDLAPNLAPLLTPAGDSYVFWNYRLEEPKEKWSVLPRALVKLRGRVTVEDRNPAGSWTSGGQVFTMSDARLVTVEFVRDDWLALWATFFRDKRSPYRIRADRVKGEAAFREFAPIALKALLEMRARPGPTADEKRLVASISPDAEVTEAFRRRTETEIHRWLVRALGPLPPDTTDLQRWFLESETKAAFLAKVRERWEGDLEALVLAHYVKDDGSTVYTRTDLAEIEASWSEERYRELRKVTGGILGR